jgi:DNA-directed RNA polymerase I, II, and III subunit RPABC2
MPANMQLLSLNPDTSLIFNKTPLSASPSRMLKLTNISNGNVAFKVKTTAPKAYLVRPSSGTLRSGDQQEVQIILQPQGADGQTNNHRFLVQAVSVNSSEQVSRDWWSEVPRDTIQEQKLNVVLEEQQAVTQPEAGSAGKIGGGGYDNFQAGSNTTSTGRVGQPVEQPGDLHGKYNELVQYTLLLEKEKKKLEFDLNEVKLAKGISSESGGRSNLQLFLVALVAFLVAYLPQVFFAAGGGQGNKAEL